MLFRRVLTAQLKRPKSSFVSANTVQQFQEIPSPKGLPIIGTTLSLIAEGSVPKLHKYIDKRHKELGPIFKERLGPTNCVFVADPDKIREVFMQEGRFPMHLKPDPWVKYNELYGCPRGLFFMDGPNWWFYRRIVNGMLLKGDFKWIEDACQCAIGRLIKQLEASDDYHKNLERTLYKWSLDIIVSVLLGAKTYKQHCEQLEEQVEKLSHIIHLVFESTAKLYLIPVSFASKFKIPPWNRFVNAVDNALANANTLVDTLIPILNPESDGLLPKLLKAEVDRDSLRRIIVDLILAAGDTTAMSMQWMLYLTSKHKDVQDKLRANPDLARNTIKEAIRLYPVATFLTRILPEDSVLGGYRVPKGTLIIMSMYTTGRDGRYFKEPNSFKPERWDRNHEDYKTDMQKATLPFGIGLRSCVGKKVAETQLQMTLLNIVNKFDIEFCNEKDIDVIMKMVVAPSEPLKLKFNKL